MQERFNLVNLVNEEDGEREKRSQLLLRFVHLAENIEPFHGKKLEDIFSSEEDKRAFLEGLQEDEFVELLNGVNGILRGKNTDEWGMDGKSVALTSAMTGVGYVPPRQEDKPELLAKVLQSAKEMSRDRKDIKDIALLLSAALNAIHPYLDANGRTSRLIYTLLTKDFNTEAETELQQILGSDGREKVDINPGLVQFEIEDLIEKETGVRNPEVNTYNIRNISDRRIDFQFSKDISDQDKNLFGDLLKNDYVFLFYSVFQYLQKNTDMEEYIYKYPKRTVIPMQLLTKNLTQEGLSKILQYYKELKKKYVEILIDSIAHPENERYQINHEGRSISLKDYFELKIREKADEIEEESRREKEKQEAKEKELAKIEQKENLIKERFDRGEGENKTLSMEEIKALQQVARETDEILEAERNFEAQQYTEEQKLDILTDSLFELSQRINTSVTISREQVVTYITEKKEELLEYFSQYHAAAELLRHLDNSQIFKYKFGTSNDNESPFFKTEDLDTKSGTLIFLNDLFSQSVYYVSENGASLRLILFEVKSKKTEEIVQPIMEVVFFSDNFVDHEKKKVVRVDDEQPTPRKFIFEIASSDFLNEIQGKTDQGVLTGVRIIRDEEGIYVNIPKGSMIHSGWRVVSIKKLR